MSGSSQGTASKRVKLSGGEEIMRRIDESSTDDSSSDSVDSEATTVCDGTDSDEEEARLRDEQDAQAHSLSYKVRCIALVKAHLNLMVAHFTCLYAISPHGLEMGALIKFIIYECGTSASIQALINRKIFNFPKYARTVHFYLDLYPGAMAEMGILATAKFITYTERLLHIHVPPFRILSKASPTLTWEGEYRGNGRFEYSREITICWDPDFQPYYELTKLVPRRGVKPLFPAIVNTRLVLEEIVRDIERMLSRMDHLYFD